MKRDADFFADTEPELVFIAKRLREAMRLEDALTAANVDYAVETDEYVDGTIFRSKRVGAFFYVHPEAKEKAVALMLEKGLRPPA